MRRYAVANRLDRKGTLTYAPPFCFDPRQAREDVARFMRSIRAELGGKPFPYVWVPEWHKDEERLHLHFGVGRYIRQTLIRDVWGHGYVSINRRPSTRHGAPEIEASRIAAGYLSKYLSKTFDRPDLVGFHRYEVAQGFQPRAIEFTGTNEGQVLDAGCEVMGSRPSFRWSSDDADDWQAPPTRTYQWG